MLKNGPHEAAVEIVFCAVTLFAGQVYKVEMACLFFLDWGCGNDWLSPESFAPGDTM